MRFKLTQKASATVFAIAVMLAAASCAGGQAADKPNPTLPTVTLTSGSVTVLAEVAKTDLEKARGLMFRKSLDAGKGMLFVFDKDERLSFWMKNTSLPLSLAYIGSDGTIYQILDLVPFSEEPRTADRSARYALEVPRGWFAEAGLKPGDRFEIPKL